MIFSEKINNKLCCGFPFFDWSTRNINTGIWVVVAFFLPPRQTPSSKDLSLFLRSRNISRSKRFSAIKNRFVFDLMTKHNFYFILFFAFPSEFTWNPWRSNVFFISRGREKHSVAFKNQIVCSKFMTIFAILVVGVLIINICPSDVSSFDQVFNACYSFTNT